MYEPSDDTYLLCDALLSDALRLRGATLVIELGPGSGTVSTCLLDILRGGRGGSGEDERHLSPPAIVVAVDVSRDACRVTLSTAAAAGVGSRLDAIQGDLLGALAPRLYNAVDVFIFNPPYVPTPDEEVPVPVLAASTDPLPAAWAGGENGRVVIDRALSLCAATLRRPSQHGDVGGTAYWVLVEENDPKDVATRLAADGLDCAIVATRRAANELLHILRISWPPYAE